jgi:hypothetical protein
MAAIGADGTECDRDHPIIDAPFRWELVEFTYRQEATWGDSYIDLVLARDGVERRLRFFGPQELELDRGLPNSSGLYISDVTGRGMEGIGVRVGSFEPDWCVPSFWASRVVEIAPCAAARDAEPDTAADAGDG